jgi:hypothetical protein
MMDQQLSEDLIELFYCLFNPPAECPLIGMNCFGIICAKNYMGIKVVQLKPMIAKSCSMGREI